LAAWRLAHVSVHPHRAAVDEARYAVRRHRLDHVPRPLHVHQPVIRRGLPGHAIRGRHVEDDIGAAHRVPDVRGARELSPDEFHPRRLEGGAVDVRTNESAYGVAAAPEREAEVTPGEAIRAG